MRRSFAVLLPVALLAVACENQSSPVSPDVTPAFSEEGERSIRLVDHCDPATFNAALGAGTCVFTHPGVTFEEFIAQLTAHGKAPAWRIAPNHLTLDEGTTLDVTNVGGEDHTYTEVEEFGGGIVDELNQLTGNTVVAPECAAFTTADLIHPGQTVPHIFDEEGVEKYQCCIHPWMRQVVRVHG